MRASALLPMLHVCPAALVRRPAIAAAAFFLLTLVSSVTAFAQAVPTVTVTLPETPPFIGNAYTFPVTFDNTGPSAGFGPYVDLILPATGADGAGAATDDGISFVSATYLGQPVVSTVLTFNASGNATHPYARDAAGNPVVVTGGTPGDQLVVLQLPFGSFTGDQPAAEILVNTNVSNLADLGTPLNIRARGGFRYGNDALDNPSTDPSIIGAYTPNQPVTPALWTVTKTYIGPEDETATGPNFPRQYRIDVDIAAGQTVTNLQLTDVLPPNLQYLAVVSTLVQGAPASTTATTTPSLTTPGGTLTRTFASVTGTASEEDASLIFSFYVPRLNASSAVVIDPTSGDDATSVNDAQSQGAWTPIDNRDPVTPVTNNGTANDHTLTPKSIAIQKSYTLSTDSGGAGPTPGDVIEYTLSIQVSDFFAMQGLVLTDTQSDGLRTDATFTPTLTITQHSGGASATAPISAANYAFVVNGAGASVGTFRVGDEQVTRGLINRLVGGCVPSAGTGGPPPDCGAFNGGGTTVTVVYRSIIQDEFDVDFPSGDPSVDHGDVLDNDVEALANLLSTTDTSASLGTNEADTSAAELVIATGSLSKTIYAINGNTAFGTPQMGPGDTVTYRLRYSLPSSDVEDLAISDFLPLPVLSATEVSTTFVSTISAAAPPAGQAKFGPDDTFFTLSGLVPTITNDAGANSVTFSYPDFDDPLNRPAVVDILFTVTASDDPFADGLFLTNQARGTESTTNTEEVSVDAIVQIQLNEPLLQIQKGVVTSDNPAGDVYSPTTVGPVSFSPPGAAGFRGLAAITSSGLDTAPINSNASGLDAGDIVTFAIIVENTGSGPDGAFDVRVRDTIPAGFSVPGTGANISVTDGNGNVLPFTNLGTGLFDQGIELTDPSASQGALTVASPGSGTNIAVITYDLQLDANVNARTALTNTATLTNYAGTQGGPDFTSVDPTDPATVTTAVPSMTKIMTATNQPHTPTTAVAIGEIVTYQLTIRVPEGVTPTAVITDTLDQGLAFVGLDTITASSALSLSAYASFAAALADAAITPTTGPVVDQGRIATITFGNLTNTDTDDGTDETIVITYRAVVLHDAVNTRGGTRNNAASLQFSGAPVTATAPNVTIVEPTLQVTKSALPASGDAGDPVTFTVTLLHTGLSNADAFNVTLTDVVPAGLTFTGASHQSGVVPTSFSAAGSLSASWTSFPDNSTSVFLVTATINAGQSSGAVLTNSADTLYTSLPGDVSAAQSTHNALSVERPGSTSGTANVTVSSAAVSKTISATNQLHTAGNNVAIGEIITYTVTVGVPEASSPNVTLVDTLDPGLAFVGFDSLVTNNPTAVTSTIPFSTVLSDATITNPGGADPVTAGSRISLNFGNITNTDTNGGIAETITLTYRVVVLNSAANLRGQARNNSAVWTTGSSSVPASAPEVTIVEPTLQVAKTVLPLSVDAGDTVTYQIVVSHGGATNADAFDVSMTDTLPAGFTLQSGPTTVAGTPPTSLTHVSGVVSATWASFPLGTTTTIEFAGTFDDTVTPGQTVTNTAGIAWTSLPGGATSLSPHNPLGAERTGNTGDPGAAANTYATDDDADVSLLTNSLSGRVFVDADGSGAYTTGEPPIVGVPMILTGTDHLGNPVSLTTTTLADGTYSFAALRPGTYTVREVQPTLFADGGDAAGSEGGTVGNDIVAAVSIPTGATTTAIDYNFGELPTADLEVTKVDVQDPAVPGGPLTYTLVVRNLGPNPAVNVVLRDPLPVGASFLSVTSPGMTCTAPAPGMTGDLECNVASLAVSATATITLNLQVDPTAVNGAIITNGVAVRSDVVDPVPTNNTDNEPTTVATTSFADLAITKADAVDPVALGTDVVYTLTIQNRGPGTASNVEVADTLPSGVTLVSAVPSQGTCTPGDPVACALGSLANGAQATITVTVTPSAVGLITNQATVTNTVVTEPDPTPTNNVAIEPTTIVNTTDADLAITKVDVADPVGIGGLVVYRILVENRGPAAATSATMADTTPAGTTFDAVVAASGWTCTTPAVGGTGLISCSTPTMAASTTAAFELHTRLDPGVPAGTTLSNTATVTSTTPDPVTPNNVTTEPTLVVDPTSVDLAIIKLDAPDVQVAGEDVSYTMLVTNRGPMTATNVTVSDPLPVGSTFVSASTGCIGAPGLVTCSGLTLLPGASAAFGIIVNSPPVPGIMNNVATVSATEPDSVPANNSDPEPTTLVDRADVRISKLGPLGATPGGSVAYTLTITNDGPSQAENVLVNDPAPAGLQFASNAGACATAFPCALGTMQPGESRTITTTFTVPSGYTTPDPISNTATVSTTSAGDNPANNSASVLTPLAFSADVEVTKTASTATPGVGTTFDYIITTRNLGPSDTTNVVIAESLPAGVTYVSHAVSLGGYDPIGATWTIPSLTAGSTAVLTLTVRADDVGPLPNTAAVTTSDRPDPEPGNNQATTTPNAVNEADVSIVKTGPASVLAGGMIAYTLTVQNNGPALATGVSVNDPLPANLTFVSNAGDCTTVFPCALGDLLPGESRTITTSYTVAVVPNGTVVTNIATVTSVTPDTNPSNNESTVNTVVNAGTDVAVTKTASPTNVQVGQPVTFTVTATNNGPNAASGVVITDQLPVGVAYESSTASVGTYDQTSGHWELGALAVGQVETLTITAIVQVPGPVTNFAVRTTQNEPDTDPSNDPAVAVINSPPYTDIGVAKFASPDTPAVGEPVTFMIVVTNRGPSAAPAVTVDDLLPAGLPFVSAIPSAGTYAADTGRWTIGPMAVDEVVTLSVVVDTPQPGVVSNRATVTGVGIPDPNPLNDQDLEVVIIGPPPSVLPINLRVSKVALRSLVADGEDVGFQITVTNDGPGVATNVVVAEPLPAGLSFVSAQVSQGTYAAAQWNVGTLAPTQSATMQITASTTAPGTTVNTVTVSVDGVDVDLRDNSDSATVIVPPSGLAELQITQEFPSVAPPNGLLTFRLVTKNNGSNVALNPYITGLIPPGTIFVSATPGPGGTCTVPGNPPPPDPSTGYPMPGAAATDPLRCTWPGLMKPGESHVLEFTVRVAPGTPTGQILWSCWWTWSQTEDPHHPNNVIDGYLFVDDGTSPVGDLAIQAGVLSEGVVGTTLPARVGEPVPMRFWVTNHGPAAARGQYALILDSANTIQLVDVQVAQGWVSPSGPSSGVWDTGMVQPGETVALDLTVRVLTPGAMELFAQRITGAPGDPNASNERAAIVLDGYGPGAAGRWVAVGNVDGAGAGEIVTGAGQGETPQVRVFTGTGIDTGLRFFAYERPFTGGVQIASCDVNGDGVAELITAPGPGRAPTIRALSLVGGVVTELIAFDAFDSSFTGGVSVACADLDADGFAEVVVGAGAGRAPEVQVYNVGLGSVTLRATFVAYEAGFLGGVRVAAGVYPGRAGWLDAFAIATTPGVGRAAELRLFTLTGTPVAQVVVSSATKGVLPTLGDVNGDGQLDLLLSPDDGRPELVRIYEIDNGEVLGDVPGGSPAFPVGIRTAVGLLDGGPGQPELVIGNGPGGHPRVRVIYWPPAGPVQRLEILPLEIP